MASITIKKRLKIQKRIRENWKRRIYRVSGGLRPNLVLAHSVYLCVSPFAMVKYLADISIMVYSKRAGIEAATLQTLLHCIAYRNITGDLHFNKQNIGDPIRQRIADMISGNLIVKVYHPRPAGLKCRPIDYYCVTPLGIDIAADFNNCLLSLQEFIKINKKVPEITPFINNYFKEQARLYP